MKNYWSRFPPPLRYTIPVMIVLFGSLSGIVSFVQEVNESYRNAEQSAVSTLRTTSAQTSRILEYLYRSSDSDNQIKTLVSQLGSYPGYDATMILSDNNIIKQSNDYRQIGMPIDITPFRVFQEDINRVRIKQAGMVLNTESTNRLIALYPVLLGTESFELRPSRTGVLLIEYDLSGVKDYAFRAALRRVLVINISLILFCLFILLFFELVLNKRIQKLVATSNELGEGRLESRSILQGSDELAQVSAAFDSMAEKMQLNAIRLERLASKEKLLREMNDRIRTSFNLDAILKTATQDILHYLHTDRVVIYRFTPGSQCCRGQFISESINPAVESVLSLEAEDPCFTSQLINHYLAGRTNVIEDVRSAQFSDCYLNFLEGLNIRSCASFPLIHTNHLWGLLSVHHCWQPKKWSSDDLELIGYVASQLSIAIQQSSLFTQIETELLEKKQAEERLIQLNHQLEDTNSELARATRLKDEFLANMSHELRTPLNGILGMAESLNDNVYGEVSANQSTALNEIINSGQHLLSLINDILDITKMEAGKLTVQLLPTLISELSEGCLATVKQLMVSKKQELAAEIESSIPLCMVDPKLLKQILINLLSNAIKFTPEGGRITMRVSLQAETGSQQGQGQLVFEVTDTGIGIEQLDQAKIFTPFVQLQSSLTRQYGGTGLGLSIVKQLVEALGGSIHLVSEPGKGSSFTVKLPFQPVAGSDHRLELERRESLLPMAKEDSPTNRDDTQSFLPARILLAEDNKVNSLVYLRYLRAKGYDLLHATNGQEAVDMAMHEPIDILLLDISMPLLDGFEVMHRLRHSADSRIANLPIIVLTALAMKGDRERCLAAGATEYLSKPVKLNQLDIAIKQVLSCKTT